MVTEPPEAAAQNPERPPRDWEKASSNALVFLMFLLVGGCTSLGVYLSQWTAADAEVIGINEDGTRIIAYWIGNCDVDVKMLNSEERDEDVGEKLTLYHAKFEGATHPVSYDMPPELVITYCLSGLFGFIIVIIVGWSIIIPKPATPAK